MRIIKWQTLRCGRVKQRFIRRLSPQRILGSRSEKNMQHKDRIKYGLSMLRLNILFTYGQQ